MEFAVIAHSCIEISITIVRGPGAFPRETLSMTGKSTPSMPILDELESLQKRHLKVSHRIGELKVWLDTAEYEKVRDAHFRALDALGKLRRSIHKGLKLKKQGKTFESAAADYKTAKTDYLAAVRASDPAKLASTVTRFYAPEVAGLTITLPAIFKA